MMTEDEVKARYNLSKWHGIALLILMILVAIGLGLSVFAIVNFAQRPYLHGLGLGIGSFLCFFFLALYALWGYKIRILSFQVLLFIVAACFFAEGIDNCIVASLPAGICYCVIGLDFVAFALTIKKTSGVPRLFAGMPIGVQFAVSCFFIYSNIASGKIDLATLCIDVLCLLLILLLMASIIPESPVWKKPPQAQKPTLKP